MTQDKEIDYGPSPKEWAEGQTYTGEPHRVEESPLYNMPDMPHDEQEEVIQSMLEDSENILRFCKTVNRYAYGYKYILPWDRELLGREDDEVVHSEHLIVVYWEAIGSYYNPVSEFEFDPETDEVWYHKDRTDEEKPTIERDAYMPY